MSITISTLNTHYAATDKAVSTFVAEAKLPTKQELITYKNEVLSVLEVVAKFAAITTVMFVTVVIALVKLAIDYKNSGKLVAHVEVYNTKAVAFDEYLAKHRATLNGFVTKHYQGSSLELQYQRITNRLTAFYGELLLTMHQPTK